MDRTYLEETAKSIVEKGILAADESTPTMTKRLESIGVVSTEKNRLAFRKILFSTAQLSEYVSGVILYTETLTQVINDITVGKFLENQGLIPGIKVDTGAKPMPFFGNSKITEGLDDLRGRLEVYKALGAKFAKWRAVLTTHDKFICIEANARALARYAATCQEMDVVPIVEPEILIEDATADAVESMTSTVLDMVFSELTRYRVDLRGIILKPNMIYSRKMTPVPDEAGEVEWIGHPENIARRTLGCLRDSVPPYVPGVAFLSGGQTDSQATNNLKAINELNKKEFNLPHRLTFSYGRALQRTPLEIWRGDNSKTPEVQKALLNNARANYFASQGSYVV